MLQALTIELRKNSRELYVAFNDGKTACVGFDQLRDASPAADGKPASPSNGITITQVEAVGNYAIRPFFSDGHNSGIYSWDFLHQFSR